jgi:hypothetical protein
VCGVWSFAPHNKSGKNDLLWDNADSLCDECDRTGQVDAIPVTNWYNEADSSLLQRSTALHIISETARHVRVVVIGLTL